MRHELGHGAMFVTTAAAHETRTRVVEYSILLNPLPETPRLDGDRTQAALTQRAAQRLQVTSSGPELQDTVVAVSRASPTVAVAGGEPQRAIRCGDDGAQSPVLSDKQRFRIGQ